MMNESDERMINLASTGYNGDRGELGVWNLKDILTGCYMSNQPGN